MKVTVKGFFFSLVCIYYLKEFEKKREIFHLLIYSLIAAMAGAAVGQSQELGAPLSLHMAEVPSAWIIFHCLLQEH